MAHDLTSGRIGAAAADYVQALAARPLRRAPPASHVPSKWQVLASLLRESWDPPPADSRNDRRLAALATVLFHVVLIVFWAWLLQLRVPSTDQAAGEEHVVQVEFIGRGTPDQTGGGAAQAAASQAPASAAAASAAMSSPPVAAASRRSAQVHRTVPSQSAASSRSPPEKPRDADIPEPAPVEQPLQVSEPARAEPAFALPQVSPPALAASRPAERPDVQMRSRAIELQDAIAAPQISAPQLRQSMPVATPATAQLQAQAREIPLQQMPELPSVTMPSVADSAAAQGPQPQARLQERSIDAVIVPEVQLPTVSGASRSAAETTVQANANVRSREIPLQGTEARQATTSSAASGQADASSKIANTGSEAATQPGETAAVPSAGQGAGRASSTKGRGPTANAPAGAWPTAQRGDDWGLSDRNRPGGNVGTGGGIYNADGSPRLPPGTAAAGGGLPPGSDKWTRELLDRNGSWAKRPPIGYDPTRFDDYWIPTGSLLEEWVRRGIKQLSIPIPGSSKKISCTISLLQAGGACGISDPDMQDVEAGARPPPDVPFKPELQEDQSGLKRP